MLYLIKECSVFFKARFLAHQETILICGQSR